MDGTCPRSYILIGMTNKDMAMYVREFLPKCGSVDEGIRLIDIFFNLPKIHAITHIALSNMDIFRTNIVFVRVRSKPDQKTRRSKINRRRT